MTLSGTLGSEGAIVVGLSRRASRRRASDGLLHGARVYLSGPMDFVASRDIEQKSGW